MTIARFLRAFFSTVVAQAFWMALNGIDLTKFDWSNPKKGVSLFVVSFIVGFLMALAKLIRETYGNDHKWVALLPA